MAGERLCALADVIPGSALKLTPEIGGRAMSVIAVRAGDDVRVYQNLCPHRDAPLDLIPGPLVTDDGGHLLCGSHNALFRIEDGICVAGPCVGLGLIEIKVDILNGAVHLLT